MDLVQEYLHLATSIVSSIEHSKNTYCIDFHDEHNRKVTRMRSIAYKIEKGYPDLKEKFCDLLFHKEQGVRLWVAHHILEVMNCQQCYRKTALREIRHKSRTDKTANGFGEKLWLKEWYKLHPKDRWI